MTLLASHIGRTVDIPPSESLPTPSDDDAWAAPDLFCNRFRIRPCQSPAELVEVYGSDDPAWLRAHFALPGDVQAAEQFARAGLVTA